VIATGLFLVYQAKTKRPTPFDEASAMLKDGRLLNLNQAPSRESLLPFLSAIENPADRQFAAEKLYAFLKDPRTGELPNVGALTRARADAAEITSRPGLKDYREELERLRQRDAERVKAGRSPAAESKVSVIAQVSELKPSFVVRTPEEFRRSFLVWSALCFLGAFAVHFAWRARKFEGDQTLLPMVQLLSGIGLILMVSLRDPLRDSLSLENFGQGILAGYAVLFAASATDVSKRFGRSRYVPLLIGLALSVALILFGSGPGSSDAKVNLLGFQPVEAIKILVVLFLAGYFAKEWEVIRLLKEKRLGGAGARLNVPRLDYVLPVVVAMGLVLLFFFLQKDLGPALILSCLFLTLYGVARQRVMMVAFGLLMMLAGFYVSSHFAISHTVADRIQIWLSPWDNNVRGGDQLVQGLWSLATGGVSGMGLGLGDPGLVPASHTDFVITALGEEVGFAGLLVLFLLYAALIYKGVVIALRSADPYAFFLALGLTLLTALQILLISLGVFGLIPLSGVVSPFISYGRTSMIANFAIVGILLSLSARPGEGEQRDFKTPVRWVMACLGVLTVVLVARAAYVQSYRGDEILVASALAPQADGVRRYQYNPRILQVARTLPRGSIYDRNGIPLATSRREELEQHRQDYERLLGVKLEDVCGRGEGRCYPFGASMFHLLGDERTRLNWAATNTAYIERDSSTRLQGYDDYAQRVELKDPETGRTNVVLRRDYRELIPLLRYRYRPDDESVKRILERERDVRTSVDIRLQLRAAQILRDQLRATDRDKGAMVVLDADTGDLLASVSYPTLDARPPALATPDGAAEELESALLDRARFGLYPPGSTFKIVTAVAALRKDPGLAKKTFDCVGLGDGRVGNTVRGWNRPIRDDKGDSAHGHVNMERGITVSCNAYFAQLGTYEVGPEALFSTASLFGVSVASPNTAAKLREAIPQSSYGQGQVVASPFQMARVAATVAAGGRMPYGRWVTDDSNQRVQPPQEVIDAAAASFLAQAMRSVITQGTATRLRDTKSQVAGKTGTAELEGQDSHSWFIGFAPYDKNSSSRIAFSVIIENGGYGGRAAVPAAGALVNAARELEIIH
jgi:cell division protein FtsW (lipid II flippase)